MHTVQRKGSGVCWPKANPTKGTHQHSPAQREERGASTVLLLLLGSQTIHLFVSKGPPEVVGVGGHWPLGLLDE